MPSKPPAAAAASRSSNVTGPTDPPARMSDPARSGATEEAAEFMRRSALPRPSGGPEHRAGPAVLPGAGQARSAGGHDRGRAATFRSSVGLHSSRAGRVGSGVRVPLAPPIEQAVLPPGGRPESFRTEGGD